MLTTFLEEPEETFAVRVGEEVWRRTNRRASFECLALRVVKIASDREECLRPKKTSRA